MKPCTLIKQRSKMLEITLKQLCLAPKTIITKVKIGVIVTMTTESSNNKAIFVMWAKSDKINFLHEANMHQILFSCKNLE